MKNKYDLELDSIGPEDVDFWDCDEEDDDDIPEECGISREDFYGYDDDPEMLDEAESDFLNSLD